MRHKVVALAPDGDYERARRVLAGGVDSPVRAGLPVGGPTPFIVSAQGSKVIDVDGREYIDYICAYGPVLLGHADPRINGAIERALNHGTVFGATHPEEVRLAERLRLLFPSMERVRFVSTGTEACMSAVRAARGYTQREKILRFEGCYHGHSDEMIFSAGASSQSAPSLECGVTQAAVHNVIVTPYNDVPAFEYAMHQNSQSIAAVIVEPIAANMGLCLPEPRFLESLRERTRELGALLIFDEVITGLRLGGGGAQARYGMIPDLTCLGKALGGGLQIAAFGGRRDVMRVLAPDGAVFVGGTFSGNPTCVAAAHASLDAVDEDPGIYNRLEEAGRRLARGFEELFKLRDSPFPVVQCGSMVDFMFRQGPAHRNLREAKEANATAYARYYHAMLDQGILLPPSQMELMFVTAAHTQSQLDETLVAASKALR